MSQPLERRYADMVGQVAVLLADAIAQGQNFSFTIMGKMAANLFSKTDLPPFSLRR